MQKIIIIVIEPVNVRLSTLNNISFAQKIELTKIEISIVSKVNKINEFKKKTCLCHSLFLHQ